MTDDEINNIINKLQIINKKLSLLNNEDTIEFILINLEKLL